MGKQQQEPTKPVQQVSTAAQQQWQEQGATPNALTNEMVGHSQNMMNNYNTAAATGMKDYGDIMGRFNTFREGLKAPQISASRPGELNESYGYLREAMPGYRDFASTGGYSPQDVQELRARGMSPIRAAYGNTMRELGRSRALGGSGGQGQYMAALSRAQREMPEQLSNAMTNVNAGLADSIRQGKMFGLQGISGTGSTMGGLSSQDAARQLQAAMSNQDAEMQANQMRLNSIGGQANLYGTSPGMASTFGNQALQAYQNSAQMEANRQNYGLGLMDMQLRANNPNMMQQNVPWWQTALGIAGTAAPIIARSDRNVKHDIKRLPEPVNERLKKLPIYNWKYKGEKTVHMGPMAQEFKRLFGVGDGKTLHAADVFGVVLASQKEAINHAV